MLIWIDFLMIIHKSPTIGTTNIKWVENWWDSDHFSNALGFGHSFLQSHNIRLFNGEEGQLKPEQVLDALVQLHVVLGDKGDGFTSATGSGCAPHSMDVIL